MSKRQSQTKLHDGKRLKITLGQTQEQISCGESGDDGCAKALSPIERLPKELVWMIFEFALESMENLRLTSHLLKELVDSWIDDFVRKPVTTPIVKKLIIANTLVINNQKIPTTTVTVKFEVSRRRRYVFELRLKSHPQLARSIKRTSLVNYDDFSYESLNPMTEDMLEHLKDSVGNHVDEVQMFYVDLYDPVDIRKIFEGINARRLSFTAAKERDDVINRLIDPLMNSIEEFDLHVYLKGLSNSRAFLINLSSQLRFVQITDSLQTHWFSGIPHADGASLIIEMFSGRMDKLCLKNNSRSAVYLTKQCADVLRERLPMLGKKLWFQTSYWSYSNPLDYVINEHRIKAYGNILSIKHISRRGVTLLRNSNVICDIALKCVNWNSAC